MTQASQERKEVKGPLTRTHDDFRTEKECWFSNAEYRLRLAKVREMMLVRRLDGLVLFSPANTFYLTGHHSIDSWEFRAVVVGHDGPPQVLLFRFERGRFLVSSWLDEARYYCQGEDPVATLLSIISESGLAGGRLGVEDNAAVFTTVLKQKLIEGVPSAELVSAARLVDEIRLCKSPEELAAIERAASLTKLGMQSAVDAAKVGATDNEVAAVATYAMLTAGSHNLVMMPTVAVGQLSGFAHSEHAGRRIDNGDSVFLELSACYQHYSAPLMKTLYMGQPTPHWNRMLDVARETAATIVKTAMPGVRACDVARAAHQAMASIEHEVQYHFNFGYSVGISYPPHWLEESAFYLTEANPLPLQTGMVFHLPLTFRVLGKCAAGMSHTIVVTDNGVRVLTGALD